MNKVGSGSTNLEVSEMHWQKTFDAVNDAICLLDIEGKILQCNKAMSDLLKMQTPDILGKTCGCLCTAL